MLPTTRTRIPMSIAKYISLLYGPPGVGKTTFVNGLAPKVLFLSTDRGTRHLAAMRIECLSWKKFESVVDELEEKKAPKYDILCIDHVDDWASMAENKIVADKDVEDLSDLKWGKGWKLYKRMMSSYMQRILNLGTGLAFIAHEEAKQFKIGGLEKDRLMPGMSKPAWKLIIPKCDIVGYCGFKRVKTEGGKKKEIRILRTQPIEEIYAKDRTERDKPEGGWERLDAKEFLETFN